MKKVHTVRGPIDPDQLGFTHTHEHILCDARMTHRCEPPTRGAYMLLDDHERAVKELRKFKDLGGSGMVELTTAAWGRDIKVLKRISEDSGVHIVATAGFYTWPYIPRQVDERSIALLTDDLIVELTEGADGAEATAGILKSAIHFDRIGGVEEKCLRAVARASIATGAAITTHTPGNRRQEIPGGNVGMQHVRILREEGVPLDRLVVGHTDEHADINFLAELAEHGCYVQFDVLDKTHYLLDLTRAKLTRELIRRGHLNRILLGTDRCRRSELYEEHGGVGYTYILETFVDMLEAEGVSSAEIDRICRVNPGEMLAYP
jgi:predicted metal-dependent phosphotriesterase family hydrolase